MTSKPATPEPEMSGQSAGRDTSDMSVPQPSIEKHPEDHDEVAKSPRSTSGDKPAQEQPSNGKPNDSENSSKGSPVTPATVTNESTADTSKPPPLPNEPLPAQQDDQDEQDDGWEFQWDQASQAYFFWNRFTNKTTWENPRVPVQPQVSTTDNTQLHTPPATAVPPMDERLPAGGYNPAIHGDYDPNAWYAKNSQEGNEPQVPIMDTAAAYAAIGSFNRFTGKWQGDDQNPDRHNDEAKSRRQMNAFFDVDAAANAHDGRSLKAERSGKKPSKSELKQFKEKRRAKKEEKRRAWLRD
ncbi:hypothetical protein HD806DRAFT_21414 [Xylariaceae sp. AK1471]|nr:hypothetical protein HD806DRAFT_21414 [Xylariaceae sp. AK1471]